MRLSFLFAVVLFAAGVGSGQKDKANSTTPNTAPNENHNLSVETVRLFSAGKFDEALPVAKKAVAAREKSAGKEHLSVASAWRNLAFIELNLKKFKEADVAFEKAVAIYEKNQPLSKVDESILAEMLEAAAYFDIGDGSLSKSASRLSRAISIRENVNGMNAAETAGPVITLGRLLHARGEYGKALPLLIRGLEIRSENEAISVGGNLLLRETAMCSLTKLDRNDEADEINRKYGSSTVGDPNTPTDNTIIGSAINGKALNLPKPAYPSEARTQRASGTVKVKVLVNEMGNVIFACGISGSKILHAASENSALRSKFAPTTLSGKPVKVSGVITYNFVP